MASDLMSTTIPNHKPIMIVGEFWGDEEEDSGKPFAGAHGAMLFGLLRQMGIDKDECYFTNAFNLRPLGGKLDGLCGPKETAIKNYRALAQGKFIQEKYKPELHRLEREIEKVNPNVILALGNIALWALCKKSGIKKYRGSPLLTHDQKYKVIPTWNPKSIFRQWELRVIVMSDLAKVRSESHFSELNRPKRLIYLEPTLADIEDFFYEYLAPSPFVSCDIETKRLQITEVGYSTASGEHAIVIPFYDRSKRDGNYWPDVKTEAVAWSWVRRINEEKPTIGQNFKYDMTYFWRLMGIPCPLFLGDTMILHHTLQPEMEKSLGFLGSLYTNEPSWKFMRNDHSTLKTED